MEKNNPKLYVLNDDTNTFEYIISSLMQICGHNEFQAEQCATIVHYAGKSAVKEDKIEVIEKMSRLLSSRGISNEIINGEEK